MSWLLICGKEDSGLENEIASKAKASLVKNKFEDRSLEYLTKLDRGIILKGSIDEDDQVLLEKLRALCKCWDVDPIVGKISSHRKFIGPFIVKSKRILFAMQRVLLKPTFEKQRNFNAQTVELLAEFIQRRR